MAHNAKLFDALHRIEELDRDAYEVIREWVDEIETNRNRSNRLQDYPNNLYEKRCHAALSQFTIIA